MTADRLSIEHFLYVQQGLQFAVPVMSVLEIVQIEEILPFHGSLAGCIGNMVHRDFLIPVIDSTALTNPLKPSEHQSETVIVVNHQDILFGLTIDRHLAVVTLEAALGPEDEGPGVLPDSFDILEAEEAEGGGTAAGPEGAEPGAESLLSRTPFIESVYGYRNNSLIVLAVDLLARAVRRQFGRQRIVSERMADATLTDSGPSGEGEAEDHQNFLCTQVETMSLAIPVERVIEVIEGSDVTPLFRVPACLRGLINLRGQVLACIDLSDEFGFDLRTLEERNQFVVIEHDRAEMVLCVDRVLGIRRLPAERFEAADSVLSGDMTRYIQGVYEEDQGTTTLLLSVPNLFAMPQLDPYRRRDS